MIFFHPNDFLSALRSVKHCAPARDVREYLNGVCIESIGSGEITLSATDGHKIAQHTCPVFGGWSSYSFRGTIPSYLISELVSQLSRSHGVAAMILNDSDRTSMLSMLRESSSIGSVDLRFSAVKGKYPDVARFGHHGGYPHSTIVSKKLLSDAVKQAVEVAKPINKETGFESPAVFYQAFNGSLFFSAIRWDAYPGSDYERAGVPVLCNVTPADQPAATRRAGVNKSYLLEALKKIATKEVRIEWDDDERSRIRLTSVDPKDRFKQPASYELINGIRL